MKKAISIIFSVISCLVAIAAITLLIIKYFDVIAHAVDKVREKFTKDRDCSAIQDACCAGLDLEPNLAEDEAF